MNEEFPHPSLLPPVRGWKSGGLCQKFYEKQEMRYEGKGTIDVREER